jgi:hypothetical protein
MIKTLIKEQAEINLDYSRAMPTYPALAISGILYCNIFSAMSG